MHTQGRWRLATVKKRALLVVSYLEGRAMVIAKILATRDQIASGEASSNALILMASKDMFEELQRVRAWLSVRSGYASEAEALAAVCRILDTAEGKKPCPISTSNLQATVGVSLSLQSKPSARPTP